MFCVRLLVAFLSMIMVLAGPAAAAEGLFAGLDLGASDPTNANYRGHVDIGATANPFVGYMFNDFLGVQGQLHITHQSPDDHLPGAAITRTNQEEVLLGGTVGPRVSIALRKLVGPVPVLQSMEVYGTGQGGVFTALSGALRHTSPGFSVGAGVNYWLTERIAVGVAGRYNRAYQKPRPNDLGPDQLGSQRLGDDARWLTAALSFTVNFARAPSPPPPPPPVAQAPPPAENVKRRIVLRAVYFDFDKADIRPDATPVLDEAVEMVRNEGLAVIAEGHTDSIGTESYNLGLSRRRAESVRQYLIAHGIPADRIQTEGFGKSRPVASNDTAEGRAQNRRVELRVE
jgi:outer membrane protein OmpA-like peptidoglycan-associated protein